MSNKFIYHYQVPSSLAIPCSWGDAGGVQPPNTKYPYNNIVQVGRSNRSVIDKFSVKKRLYIGRTTMDAQLSFVMANLAMVGIHLFLEECS